MAASTVASLLRATQAHCLQICEKTTLDYGIAYYTKRFASLPQANQFREVIADTPETAQVAFAENEKLFREQGLTCLRWAAAGGMFKPPMTDVLSANGFEAHAHSAMILTRWPALVPPPGVRVLPGRAMRGVVERLACESSDLPIEQRQQAADAQLERLDQPQYDLFLALVDGAPAGQCALLQVGDFTCITDLVVVPEFGVQSLERALFHHVLALAHRLTMRTVLMQVNEADAPLRGRLTEMGFVEDGRIVEFERRPAGL